MAAAPRGRAAPSTRVATLDWAILETLLALGAPPVAAAELVQFRAIAGEALPAGIADLGLRGLPNLETLLLARPRLIFNSNFYAALGPRLAAIAPVESFTLYLPGQAPWAPMEAMTRAVAARLGRAEAAESYLDSVEAAFSGLRAQLGMPGETVLPINLGDTGHYRSFGFDSMIGEALPRLGLVNASPGSTRYSAAAPLGIESLAGYGTASLAIIGPTAPDIRARLDASPFWQDLPPVRAGRVLWLPPVDPFGAIPSSLRFARLLVEALCAARMSARG
nr:iron-siderophore ABC transporter substrate-binding protein [Ancylobacter crimeensis]